MKREISNILSSFECMRGDPVLTTDWILDTIRSGAKLRMYDLSDRHIIDSMSDSDLREVIAEWMETPAP